MKTKIIAFAGGKGCGKTTSMNFLHGYQLRAYNIIDDFGISNSGSLFVKTEIEQDGKTEIADTYLDVNRQDLEFIEWCMYNVWPFVKKYSFADPLKQMAISLFGLKHEQVYGTEEHKKQVVSRLRWENMPGVISESDAFHLENGGHLDFTVHDPGPMTVRDFLQYFGTDICRKIREDIWVNRCIEDIKAEEPLLAIIDDCRFLNEIEGIQAVGGKVIGLNRSVYGKDTHESETEIKKHWDKLDYVIDNNDMSIHETCKEIINAVGHFGWLQEAIRSNSKDPTKRKIHTIKED